jgi:ABC transport system ATP-binding/permease protein
MPDVRGAGQQLCLEVEGHRLELDPSREVILGRGEHCDVVLSDLRVSREHLHLRHAPGQGWVMTDLDSRGGTHVAGRPITSATVQGSVTARLGDPDRGIELLLEVRAAATPPIGVDVRGASTALPEPGPGPDPVTEAQPRASVVTIGRADDNDVVLPDLLISRYHASIREVAAGRWELEDLGSANGTFVDGRSVERAELADGAVFSVARRPVQLRDGHLDLDPGPNIPALQCEGVGVVLDPDVRILSDISLRAAVGSLTAVLGPTGAGKSTLLKVLTGSRRPSDGDVLIGGRDLYAAPDAIRPMLGYVPQNDILHPQLTIGRALTYAAELRLPPDVADQEIERRVAEVLDELGLAHRRDLPITRLSGGQRKRTSVALELLTAPEVLLLDEPTSGLDPGYEQSVMELLRRLADAGRTVVVVTHSMQSLALCDQVLFLATGGRTAYLGPPGEALTVFGRTDYAKVFQDLEHWSEPSPPPPRDPPTRLDDASDQRMAGAPDVRDPADRERWLRQLSTLSRRQIAVIAADRRVLLFLLAAVVVPAALMLAVVDAGALDADGELPSDGARTLLGALVVSAVAIGAANTLREIVKERAILARERAVGVADSAYVTSKFLVFGTITALQAVLLVAIVTSTSRVSPGASATSCTSFSITATRLPVMPQNVTR